MPASLPKAFQPYSKLFNMVPHDVVGIEWRSDSLRALRLKRNRTLHLEGCAVLRSLPPTGEARLSLPPHLKGVHAGLLYSGEDAVVKLLTLPGHTVLDESHVRDAMGLKGDDQMRIGFQVLREGTRRAEHRILAASMPEPVAAGLPAMLADLRPVPYTLELSPIALLNAFFMTQPAREEAITGLIFADVDYCLFAFFRNRELLLIRRYGQGSAGVLKHISHKLGVDAQTANDIVRSGAVDLSAAVADVVTPLIRQITLSRDFIERHANQPVGSMFLGGSPTVAQALQSALQTTLRVDCLEWTPFEDAGLDLSPFPELLEQPWSFYAAFGSCLGILDTEGATA